MSMHQAQTARVLIAGSANPSTDALKELLPPKFEIIPKQRNNKNQPLNRAAIELKPDIILIDIAWALQDRFKAVVEIIQHLPHTRVILYPNDRGAACGAESAAKASIGTVPGDYEFVSRIVEFSRHGQAGSKFNGHGTPVPTDGSTIPSSLPLKEVTDREHEVLALLAAGYPMKQIAYRLGITYRTVTFHKYRMMERLGITTNAGLMNYALRRSIILKESLVASLRDQAAFVLSRSDENGRAGPRIGTIARAHRRRISPSGFISRSHPARTTVNFDGWRQRLGVLPIGQCSPRAVPSAGVVMWKAGSCGKGRVAILIIEE